MFSPRLITSLVRTSTTKFSTSSSSPRIAATTIRFASSVRTADLPKAPPHDKVPFSAPPKDETKGDLGQVWMPEMKDPKEQQAMEMKIPSAPDNYTVSKQDSETDDFPSLQERKVQTVSDPSTYAGGGPSSMASSADDTFEGLPGDNELPASANKVDGKDQISSSEDHDGKKNDKNKKEKSYENEPLNQEEKKGLYVLGGIVVGGYVLSGLTRPFKPEVQQHHEVEV